MHAIFLHFRPFIPRSLQGLQLQDKSLQNLTAVRNLIIFPELQTPFPPQGQLLWPSSSFLLQVWGRHGRRCTAAPIILPPPPPPILTRPDGSCNPTASGQSHVPQVKRTPPHINQKQSCWPVVQSSTSQFHFYRASACYCSEESWAAPLT